MGINPFLTATNQPKGISAMKKPIFWVVIIIVLAIILFVYMRHKPAVTTNPNSQTSALLVPAKTVAVTNDDTAENTANPAANTPAQETQTLNPNNNNAANVNDNDTNVTNPAVNAGRANENTGSTTDQTSSDS